MILQLLESLGDGALLVDLDRFGRPVLRDFNRKAASLFALGDEEKLGWEFLPIWDQWIHPTHAGKRPAFAMHQDEQIEVMMQTEEASKCWLEVTVTPFAMLSGKPKWLLLLRDISNVRMAEAELRKALAESERRYSAIKRSFNSEFLFHQINATLRMDRDGAHQGEMLSCDIGRAFSASRCLIHSADEKSHFLLNAEYDAYPEYAFPRNPELERWLYQHVEETREKAIVIDDIDQHSDQRLRVMLKAQHVKSLLAIGIFFQEQRVGILVLKQCSQKRSWQEQEITLLEAVARELAVGISHARLLHHLKISRKELEWQTQELARALEKEREFSALQAEFVSLASHELRTPLAIVDSSLQLLKRHGNADPEMLTKHLDRIERAVNRMGLLIETTLNLSRLENGGSQFSPHHFELGGLLKEICGRYREMEPKRHVSLTLPLMPIRAYGDVKLLEQMFANLVGNAVKYSPLESEVEVSVIPEDRHWVISVRDHGIGIPEQELPRIFDKFFRAGNTTGIAGTGLGLYLVRSIAQMHQGDVFVESKVGKGSCFFVNLPIAPDHFNHEENHDAHSMH